MSIWTHAAGVIRIDDLCPDNRNLDFDELIGKECSFYSPIEVWKDRDEHPDDYMPTGSEGSLEKSIWVNPDKHCAAAYTVTIFGDLRDYNTPELIIEWFKKKCEKLSFMVRNAVITAECEIGETIIYHYDGNSKTGKEIIL